MSEARPFGEIAAAIVARCETMMELQGLLTRMTSPDMRRNRIRNALLKGDVTLEESNLLMEIHGGESL